MPYASDGWHTPPVLDGRWPAASGGGPGLGGGGPRLATLPVGCFFLAAATLAWYLVYVLSAVTQFFCATYALRHSSTAVWRLPAVV